MKILQEFKKFAIKGNVVDMGVGIIIGGAFGSIVSSLVNDVIMPPIGLLTGGMDFSNKVWILKQATETTSAVTLNYGTFINSVLTFLIVAITIFFVIKQMNKVQDLLDGEDSSSPKPAPRPPKDIQLLTEIRDLMKDSVNSENSPR